MGRLAGKVAILTGGASGIGKASALRLAAEGCKVTLTDIDETAGAEVADAITQDGGEAAFIRQDVTDEASWHEAFDATVARFGRLDALVNNAGVALDRLIAETTLADWRRLMSVNLDAVFLGTKLAMEVLPAYGGGAIVNVSSVFGLVGGVRVGAYCASKGGVRLFTKAAAMECASAGTNVRVNSVHPGFIETPMITDVIADSSEPEKLRRVVENYMALRRLGDPADVANAIVYLVSDEAAFVTGAELVIDGGMTAR